LTARGTGIPAAINNPIIKMEATPLFTAWLAQRTMVNAVIARTICAIRESPWGVGSIATAAPSTIATPNQIHLEVLTAAAGGAATVVLIVSRIGMVSQNPLAASPRLG